MPSGVSLQLDTEPQLRPSIQSEGPDRTCSIMHQPTSVQACKHGDIIPHAQACLSYAIALQMQLCLWQNCDAYLVHMLESSTHEDVKMIMHVSSGTRIPAYYLGPSLQVSAGKLQPQLGRRMCPCLASVEAHSLHQRGCCHNWHSSRLPKFQHHMAAAEQCSQPPIAVLKGIRIGKGMYELHT